MRLEMRLELVRARRPVALACSLLPNRLSASPSRLHRISIASPHETIRLVHGRRLVSVPVRRMTSRGGATPPRFTSVGGSCADRPFGRCAPPTSLLSEGEALYEEYEDLSPNGIVCLR